MELWIPITIAAAFSQNLRFMLQKHLKATGLSTGGATFARFLFAAPLAAALLAVFDVGQWVGHAPDEWAVSDVCGHGRCGADIGDHVGGGAVFRT